MSMAGGNPSLIIDTLVNSAGLGVGLRNAEAQVTASATRMGTAVDAQMGKFGTQLAGGLARGLSAMMAIQAADAAIRATTDAFRNNRDIPDAILESLQKTFSSLPIFGALQDALIPLGEKLGESMARSAVGVMQREFGLFQGIVFGGRTRDDDIRAEREELARLRTQIDPGSVQAVDTAIGRFRFAMAGGPQEEQLEILRRIRQLMESLGESVRPGN